MTHWLAVDPDETEWIFSEKPYRESDACTEYWACFKNNVETYNLPKGTAEKLAGEALTWADEPLELIDVLVHVNSIDGSFAYIEALDEYHARQEIILKHQIGELGDIGQLMINNGAIHFTEDS